MTTRDLMNQIPDTADLLALLGLERRNQSETIASAFAIFGAGLAIGAALALLLTPKNGQEMREEIADRASKLRDNLRTPRAAGASHD